MPMRDLPFMARTAGTVTFLRCSLIFTPPWGRGAAATRLSYTPSRSVDSGSKRYVVLSSLLSVANLLHELFEMLGRVHEIDLVRVDDQQRRLVVAVEVMRVRLTELLQIR